MLPTSPPTSATFSANQAVELAVLERSAFIESRHIGSAIVTAPDGSALITLGAPHAPIFARSTLKPFQTLAALRARASLQGPEVAIACGSHTGSFAHTDVVASILKKAHLTADALQCPAVWPQDLEAYRWSLRTEHGKSRLAMTCSGKHAAFLLACVESSWDVRSYTNPEHPLQQIVFDTLTDFTDEPPQHTGIDGCGMPVAAWSLTGLARAYGRLGRAPSNSRGDARAATVATAMLDYPWAVGGRGEPNTVVLEELHLLAKMGAEGILCIGTAEGVGVCVKLLDGSSRATSLVALALLVAASALPDAAAASIMPKIVEPIRGGDQVVGRLRLAHPVADLLGAAEL